SIGLRGVLQRAARSGHDRPAEFQDLVDNLFGGLDHQELLAIRQSDHGIGSTFDMLNQIRIDDEWNAVQPSQLDHKAHSPGGPFRIWRLTHLSSPGRQTFTTYLECWVQVKCRTIKCLGTS